MNSAQLKAFCNLLMASDPSPLSLDDDTMLTAWANEEAKRHGFSDWIAAFHLIRPDSPADTFLVSWTGGYEPSQLSVHPTEAEAWERRDEWSTEMKPEDTIEVFGIDLGSNTIKRLERPVPSHPERPVSSRTEPTWSVINDGIDRQYDGVPSSPGIYRFAQIGPEGDDRWSWTIIATDEKTLDQYDEVSGDAEDEAAARASVEAWRPESYTQGSDRSIPQE